MAHEIGGTTLQARNYVYLGLVVARRRQSAQNRVESYENWVPTSRLENVLIK